MSETLAELLESDGALGILRAYGLDRILTEQDDPQLWASALVRYWPAPWDPDVDPAALRFGIGTLVADGRQTGIAGRSGMEQIEEWCFERLDPDHLQVARCTQGPAISFMAMVVGGSFPPADEQRLSWVRDYLDISRPSLGEGRALVHKGMSAPLNAGAGETRYWERKEDGSWVESDELFSRWLT